MPIQAGSKIRHLHGPSLRLLEDQLEGLSYKAQVIQVQKIASNWYIHFYVPETSIEQPEVKKETSKKTKTTKIRSK